MVSTTFRRAVRERLNSSPAAYEVVRNGVVLFNALLHRVHDPDYHALAETRKPVVRIADIGANMGQSLVSLRAIFPKAHIDAFEPNLRCKGSLNRISRIVGNAEVRHCGLGSSPGDLPFYVPSVNSVDQLQEGTFDRGALDDPLVKDRIGENFVINEHILPVITLDSLGQDYDVMKIDVQGVELSVLKGATETLMRCRPALLIEGDYRYDEPIEVFLTGLGYVRKMLQTNHLYTLSAETLPASPK